ncbi:hypothetical protein NUW58_g2985 [Xylaria curta]|uniref:Uncharacterized protein n=1 Tax=Xylaria curta TaxID=42375 RepID=A0ACC1PEM8_9PEZI|nr:hypothetical protein NUW58_g2985 [Xylaria curta]
MAFSAPAICLDVAIDHRIRRLCKPTLEPRGVPEPSEHLSILQQHGVRLGRGTDEINVTTRLAGPATTGGILVTLKQPRYNHPFKDGLGAVIRDCDTLSALEQLFQVASCGMLTLKHDVSLVDLLPFTPQQTETIPPQALRNALEASRLAICAKHPDVVLCAGKIWLPNEDKDRTKEPTNQENLDIKGGLQKLEAAGVGQLDIYDAVGLPGSGGELVTMSRVNGFHPSYAMNYLPEHTNLRQLLLLNVVKTCGLYREDWQEMRRKKMANQPRSLDRERIAYGRSRTILDYVRIYRGIQKNFLSSIGKIENSDTKPNEDLYSNLLTSRLSYKCNDASVVLRKIHELFITGLPESNSPVNLENITAIGIETLQIAERFTKTPFRTRNLRLKEMLDVGMTSVNSCFVDLGPDSRFNIEMLADIFLQMALGIEEILSDLLEIESRRRSTIEL